MLHKLNEATIISDEGFKVIFGHHQVTYEDTQNNKSVSIEIEDELNPHQLLIYLSSTKLIWSDGEEVSEIMRKLIEQQIEKSASALKINYKVV